MEGAVQRAEMAGAWEGEGGSAAVEGATGGGCNEFRSPRNPHQSRSARTALPGHHHHTDGQKSRGTRYCKALYTRSCHSLETGLPPGSGLLRGLASLSCWFRARHGAKAAVPRRRGRPRGPAHRRYHRACRLGPRRGGLVVEAGGHGRSQPGKWQAPTSRPSSCAVQERACSERATSARLGRRRSRICCVGVCNTVSKTYGNTRFSDR